MVSFHNERFSVINQSHVEKFKYIFEMPSENRNLFVKIQPKKARLIIQI